jgi:type I restriction enzyme R subunit
MSAKAYSEDELVDQSAIELLAGPGWRTIEAFDEVFGPGGTPGRDNMGRAVLWRHLVPALKKLSPRTPAETRDRRTRSWSAADIEAPAWQGPNPGAFDGVYAGGGTVEGSKLNTEMA